jgi:hypothetical protein
MPFPLPVVRTYKYPHTTAVRGAEKKADRKNVNPSWVWMNRKYRRACMPATHTEETSQGVRG